MRRRCGCILCLLLLGLSACENKTLNQTEEEHSNVITVSEEEITENSYTENSDEALSSESIREEDTSGILDIQQYSNASIYFEYPVEWVLTEQQGEDGTCVSISNSNEEDGADFTLVQGEAWRVNLDYAKEDYVQLLCEKYEALEITDLSTIIIDGYDAKKLQFTYKENEQEYMAAKYMVVVDLVSFEMTYIYPSEQIKEYETQGENILATMQFTIAKSAVQQAFLSVLLNEEIFECSGNDYDFHYNGYLKELKDGERIREFPQFAINDLDGDEVPEIILAEKEYIGFIVLRYREGKVYGTDMNYRAMFNLRENGMAYGTSSAADYIMAKRYFIGNKIVSNDKLHSDCYYTPNYYIDDVPVTKEEFEQLETKIYYEVSETEWYDFTKESIKQHITESPLFVDVSEEKALRMQQRQEYMDSLSYLLEIKGAYVGKSQEEKNENAKQYYYECKGELDKIYKLCKANFKQEELTKLKKEQQYWEEGIKKRLAADLLQYNAYSIEDLKEQWLYYEYGDVYLRRALYLINCYYGCDFYD